MIFFSFMKIKIKKKNDEKRWTEVSAYSSVTREHLDYTMCLTNIIHIYWLDFRQLIDYIVLGLFWRIWHMDLVQSAVLYAVMTLVSTYLVAFAYKNVKFVLKHK